MEREDGTDGADKAGADNVTDATDSTSTINATTTNTTTTFFLVYGRGRFLIVFLSVVEINGVLKKLIHGVLRIKNTGVLNRRVGPSKK